MSSLALKPGSTVFVTGINGLIGSHVADQLLLRGYNVRGAVRDVEKAAWLKEYFANKHEKATLELVAVPDMTVEGCYDDFVKGTDGFVHVASPLNGEDPHSTIPIAVKGGLNALQAAFKEPKVKRVVFTSSSIAATFPKPNVEFSIDETSYNEEGIQRGWNPSPDEHPGTRSLNLYAALKTETEKAMWKWVEENKPSFVFNSVLPNVNFGKVLVPEKQGTPSTIRWAQTIFTGDNFDMITHVIPPQWYIDTVDCALLHVGALIHSEVNNERLFAFAETYNWNQLLGIYRRLYPERTFRGDIQDTSVDKMTVPNQRAEEVLKWVKGSGWTSLEESLKVMARDFE